MLQRGHRFVLFQILLGLITFLCFAGLWFFFSGLTPSNFKEASSNYSKVMSICKKGLAFPFNILLLLTIIYHSTPCSSIAFFCQGLAPWFYLLLTWYFTGRVVLVVLLEKETKCF